MEKEVVVSVSGVSKRFGKLLAVDDVSFEIERNTIFGLLGSNGAGKTTMMHMLTNLLTPSKGEIRILGEDTINFSKSLKSKVAIVPQKISLYEELTIYDNLYFFGKMYNLKRKEILDKIEGFAETLQLGDLGRKTKHLSGGYQRKARRAWNQ